MLILLDIPSYKTVPFDVCAVRPLADLETQLAERYGFSLQEKEPGCTYIVGRHGLTAEDTLRNTQGIPWLSLRGRLCGGKGGFGSMLRSQGNKMAANKPANYDNCRDLYGRRLKTLKEAKGIVDKLEDEEKAREEARERRRKKIEEGLKERPAKKYRFEDTEYTRNCEDIVESTKKATRKALREKVSKRREPSEEDESESSGSGKSAAAATAVPLVPLFDGDLSGISSSDSSSESGSESEPESEPESDAKDSAPAQEEANERGEGEGESESESE
ncbi:hypothetical protein GQ54DRAFT_295730 [Martensiomyces pterosporus]|nr:hypothetical protein GQ54DRAFT_295730 [Martensiomyces pterosporus]